QVAAVVDVLAVAEQGALGLGARGLTAPSELALTAGVALALAVDLTGGVGLHLAGAFTAGLALRLAVHRGVGIDVALAFTLGAGGGFAARLALGLALAGFAVGAAVGLGRSATVCLAVEARRIHLATG